MLGTIVNAGAIIIGALLGNLLRSGFPEKYKAVIMQGISLVVILIGLSMALQTENVLVLTLSIVSGGIMGELLRIEERLTGLGEKLESRFNSAGGQGGKLFTKGFVTASLVFCVGAMAIMGALESGLTGRHTTLFIKAIIDGVTATVFGSTMGLGVAFSGLPVLLYQGAITVAAAYVKPFLTEAMITEMTAVGGLLIFGIGLNLLTDKLQIKVGNLLPAIFLAIFFVVLLGRLPL
ncbi:MAG: DUF554 domain-containing protein [Firmicutes bacterium]|nr:DUF554 domain-containing protein [Bacillota bacterium]